VQYWGIILDQFVTLFRARIPIFISLDILKMATICKNCNHTLEGNYCNYCGQAADTHKLTMHFIWHDLQHGLFHFDNGIFYTIKQLLTRPGHAIREFINGKRVRHFKPLTLVVVLATLYGLLYHYLIDNIFDIQPIGVGEENVVSAYEKVTGWLTDHFAYASLILVVISSIVSYQVFKKQGHNFAEHLVLNTYYIGLVLVVNLILLPVLYIFHKDDSRNLMAYALITQNLNFFLMYWCYAQFFNKLSKIQSFGLTILSYLFVSIITLILGWIGGWIFMILPRS
jgi:Protein of unknown function (DUF3667)